MRSSIYEKRPVVRANSGGDKGDTALSAQERRQFITELLFYASIGTLQLCQKTTRRGRLHVGVLHGLVRAGVRSGAPCGLYMALPEASSFSSVHAERTHATMHARHPPHVVCLLAHHALAPPSPCNLPVGPTSPPPCP